MSASTETLRWSSREDCPEECTWDSRSALWSGRRASSCDTTDIGAASTPTCRAWHRRKGDKEKCATSAASKAPASFSSKRALASYMLVPMPDITKILSAIKSGDPKAAAELLPLVYNELRKLAAARLAAEKPGQTLDGTALVHEAYLRLVGSETDDQWNSKAHFFGAAAEAMRRILIDRARRKQRPKHGGDRDRTSLKELPAPPAREQMTDLVALDEALTALARESPG